MRTATIIDLTLKISPSIRVFPGSPQSCLIPWNTFSAHSYDSEAVFMSTHTGTHMDAPSHFIRGGDSIDRISPGRFVAEATIAKIPKKPNGLVKVSDIKDHEIRENDAVVIATGWEKHIRQKNYMTENPGLSASAARYLVRKKVSVVAIDGPSIDAGSDARFTAHKILLANNVLVLENLCNVSRITKKRFTLAMAPLKLEGSTGSPVRAFALL
jgi:kynurenine formamidase